MKANMSIGGIAYLIGFFGAVLIGLLSAFELFEMTVILSSVLIVSGLIIGLLNVGKKEKVPIMIASLIIGAGAGVLSTLEFVGEFFVSILSAMALVAVPVGIVVAVMVLMDKANK